MDIYSTKNGWVLLDKNNNELKVGDTLIDEDKTYTIISLSPPHKPSSSGKIYVKRDDSDMSQGLYAHCFDAKYHYRG